MADTVLLNPVEPATTLEVRPALLPDNSTAPGQFWVEGYAPGREWREKHVCFSGYYGSYGPQVFAAAPELLAALKECAEELDMRGCSATFEPVRSALVAIAKAEGGAA